MNMVIVVEIVAAIFVLVAAVRFAVRDTRRRSGAGLPQPSGLQDNREVPEREAGEQHRHEVGDQQDGEDAAALSVSSSGLEPPTDTR